MKNALLAALLLCTSAAHALSLDLVYVGDNTFNEDGQLLANVGDVLAFEVQLDIGDLSVLGGVYDITFSSDTLGFLDYTDAGAGEPIFTQDPIVFDGFLESAAAGAFDGFGSTLFATMQFEVIAAGAFSIDLSDSLIFTGSWVSAADFVTVYPLDFGGIDGIAAVPLPGAVWLLLSGIGGFAALRRKRI